MSDNPMILCGDYFDDMRLWVVPVTHDSYIFVREDMKNGTYENRTSNPCTVKPNFSRPADHFEAPESLLEFVRQEGYELYQKE